MQARGDRFISQRNFDEDMASLFITKNELFAPASNSPQKQQKDERANNEDGQQQQNQEDTQQIEEENKKTYRALLQHQVLGIDNPHLLHEIHNSEDFMHQQNLYSQMQQNAENVDMVGDGLLGGSPGNRRENMSNSSGSPLQYRINPNSNGANKGNSDQCKGYNNSELSPFNSKFTVLKFGSANSSGKTKTTAQTPQLRPFELSPQDNNQNQASEENLLKGIAKTKIGTSIKPSICKNLFKSSFSSEGIPSALRTQKVLSENLNPIQEESQMDEIFTRKPFCGFDHEQVIVPKTKQRQIPKIPYKVLDAPALKDDYYLNLVDWSELNDLVVGLSSCVYIWSATSSKVTKLYDLGQNDEVTSVSWARRGQYLSVGTDSGMVQVWDVTKQKLVRVFQGHQGRVGALAWNSNLLSSGSKDRSIQNHDLRCKEDAVSIWTGHKQEVCGLKWSHDDMQLASGGNDNKLMVWSAHAKSGSDPLWKFGSHKAAVKALAWSPHQKGLLVSGGGTQDRCIRFWNTIHGFETQSVQTDSQVCNLMFSKNVNELVSTHGYSENAVVVWKYPSMRKLATLTGHNLRVLYLAMSPDGESIVTGAGDETLRFWKVFPKSRKLEKRHSMIETSAFVIR